MDWNKLDRNFWCMLPKIRFTLFFLAALSVPEFNTSALRRILLPQKPQMSVRTIKVHPVWTLLAYIRPKERFLMPYLVFSTTSLLSCCRYSRRLLGRSRSLWLASSVCSRLKCFWGLRLRLLWYLCSLFSLSFLRVSIVLMCLSGKHD